MYKVVCSGNKKGSPCKRWLGAVSCETVNTVQFYCRDCGTLHEYQYTGKLLRHRIIPQKTNMDYDPSITVVE